MPIFQALLGDRRPVYREDWENYYRRREVRTDYDRSRPITWRFGSTNRHGRSTPAPEPDRHHHRQHHSRPHHGGHRHHRPEAQGRRASAERPGPNHHPRPRRPSRDRHEPNWTHTDERFYQELIALYAFIGVRGREIVRSTRGERLSPARIWEVLDHKYECGADPPLNPPELRRRARDGRPFGPEDGLRMYRRFKHAHVRSRDWRFYAGVIRNQGYWEQEAVYMMDQALSRFRRR